MAGEANDDIVTVCRLNRVNELSPSQATITLVALARAQVLATEAVPASFGLLRASGITCVKDDDSAEARAAAVTARDALLADTSLASHLMELPAAVRGSLTGVAHAESGAQPRISPTTLSWQLTARLPAPAALRGQWVKLTSTAARLSAQLVFLRRQARRSVRRM